MSLLKWKTEVRKFLNAFRVFVVLNSDKHKLDYAKPTLMLERCKKVVKIHNKNNGLNCLNC